MSSTAEIATLSVSNTTSIPFPDQHAMLVCMSGLPSPEKTRIAHDLEYAFRREGIQAEYQRLCGGSSTFAEIVIRFCRFRPEKIAALRQIPGMKTTLQFHTGRMLLQILVAIDLLEFCILRVGLPLLLGKVVICDGYSFDTLCDFASRYERDVLSGTMTRLEKFLHFFYPEPDLNYLLLGSSQDLQLAAGGSGAGADVTQVQLRLYLTRYRESAKFLIRSADGDYDRLEKQIVRESLKKYWQMANSSGKDSDV